MARRSAIGSWVKHDTHRYLRDRPVQRDEAHRSRVSTATSIRPDRASEVTGLTPRLGG
jgi:hypothetical protein